MNKILEQIKRKYRGIKIRYRNKYSPRVLKSKKLIVPKIYKAPPIEITGSSEFEVHVLVSSRDFSAMLWGLYSFYSYAPSDISLVVHDDGSLNKNHRKQLEAVFPGSTLIYRSESDMKIEKEFSSFPRLKKYRKAHATHIKVIDFFVFSSKSNILFFDSDIIFFRRPDRMIKQETQENLFIQDMGTSYVLSPEEIASDFQITVPPKINTGFGRVNKNCFDVKFLDFCLAHEKLGRGLFTSEQTLVAMMAARKGGVETVGGEYQMDRKLGVEGRVVKHYVNIMRDLLYTEGIPWVYENILKNKE